MSLDTVDYSTRSHNPKVGGSNPPPATNTKALVRSCFPSRGFPILERMSLGRESACRCSLCVLRRRQSTAVCVLRVELPVRV
jgi:hypothetical protein